MGRKVLALPTLLLLGFTATSCSDNTGAGGDVAPTQQEVLEALGDAYLDITDGSWIELRRTVEASPGETDEVIIHGEREFGQRTVSVPNSKDRAVLLDVRTGERILEQVELNKADYSITGILNDAVALDATKALLVDCATSNGCSGEAVIKFNDEGLLTFIPKLNEDGTWTFTTTNSLSFEMLQQLVASS